MIQIISNTTFFHQFGIEINSDHTIYDGGYSFNRYINQTTTLIRNETQFLDDNDNKLNYTTSKSVRNFECQFDDSATEDKEPPLLDELEIYPEQIAKKAITMINPFASDEYAIEQFLVDIDLSGPILFCFLFGLCLFLAGKVFIFSNLYGLSMISIVFVYGLLQLMSYGHQYHFITIRGVASALGYGMLHLIWFSFIGIFMRLDTFNGFILAVPAVVMSTCGASRILSMMSNRPNSGVLIAYPTAMVYIMFVLLVVF